MGVVGGCQRVSAGVCTGCGVVAEGSRLGHTCQKYLYQFAVSFSSPVGFTF